MSTPSNVTKVLGVLKKLSGCMDDLIGMSMDASASKVHSAFNYIREGQEQPVEKKESGQGKLYPDEAPGGPAPTAGKGPGRRGRGRPRKNQ